MAELSTRDKSARSIRNIFEFTKDERFQKRLMVELQSRLRALESAWERFQHNHELLVEAAMEKNAQDEVEQHQQLFDEIQNSYGDAYGRIQARISEHQQAFEQMQRNSSAPNGDDEIHSDSDDESRQSQLHDDEVHLDSDDESRQSQLHDDEVHLDSDDESRQSQLHDDDRSIETSRDGEQEQFNDNGNQERLPLNAGNIEQRNNEHIRPNHRENRANDIFSTPRASETKGNRRPYRDSYRNQTPNTEPIQNAFDQFGMLVQRMCMGFSNKKENTWGTFDGTLSTWQGFRDGFKAAVHDDRLISPVFKFQMLKSSLTGKALSALGEWQVNDRNYYEAWNWLNELYNRQYHTSKQILWKLLDFPRIERASGAKIEQLCNVAQEVVRQLRAMKYPVEYYDMIFVHTIHNKLDSYTSKDWELSRKSETPRLKEMLMFLQQQGRALSSAHYNETDSNKDNRKRSSNGKEQKYDSKKTRYGHSSGGHNESNANSRADNRKCKVCDESHPVHKCPKFMKMDLKTRKEEARALNLCFNCLFPSHNAKDCRANACKRCENKKHNSLLCTQNPYNKTVNTVEVKPVGQNPKKQQNKKKEKKEPKQ